MDVEQPVGVAVDRDLGRADSDIDAFISKRDKKRRAQEGDRAAEMAWKESTRRFNAAREAEMRDAWGEYHRAQAERHKAVLASLIEHHEQQAQKFGGDAA